MERTSLSLYLHSEFRVLDQIYNYSGITIDIGFLFGNRGELCGCPPLPSGGCFGSGPVNLCKRRALTISTQGNQKRSRRDKTQKRLLRKYSSSNIYFRLGLNHAHITWITRAIARPVKCGVYSQFTWVINQSTVILNSYITFTES